MQKFGIPYMGSKSTIAEWVISHLPPADNLVDLCAGVNTMFLCMLVKSVKYIAASYRWYFGLDKDKSKQKEL